MIHVEPQITNPRLKKTNDDRESFLINRKKIDIRPCN